VNLQTHTREQTAKSAGRYVSVGNTGVTKVAVVERGALRRDEARKDQKYHRGKFFEVQGGAGCGD
jgi:hypothetical protein